MRKSVIILFRMRAKKIYFDYSATTPIDKNVLKAMLPYLKEHYGNPSSMHYFGQQAAIGMEKARDQVASILHCDLTEVIFTAGATEANNMAIQGVIKTHVSSDRKPHVVISAIEHESVIALCETLEQRGEIELTRVSPNKEGIIEADAVEGVIKDSTVFVSVMYANSVIGTVQPIAEIGAMIKRVNGAHAANEKIVFHSDAVQALQYLPCNVQDLSVDLLTISGHKIYGPKGIGALFVRDGIQLAPTIIGGGQEYGMRGGTQNVAAIAGLGAAVHELQNGRTDIVNVKIRQLRDRLVKAVLKAIPDARVSGSLEKRLPSNAHFLFDDVEGRDVVVALDQRGFAVATGSACSEKSQEPDHVLIALYGLSEDAVRGGVRITLGKYTTKEEVDKLIKALPEVIKQLRGV